MASAPGDTRLHDGRTDVSIQRLYQELVDAEQIDGAIDIGDSSQQRSEELVTAVLDTLFPGSPFGFDEELVKNNLDEILVLLIALRDNETHGKGLMEDLSRLFDSRLSPGTVYPRLHDLEEENILEMQELVRTKEYRIDDAEQARDLVEESMRQHLALGFFLYASLSEL